MTTTRDGERRILDPFTMVIFGATGDLTERKLMPALYHLAADGYLPVDFTVIGVARREWTDEYMREKMREAVARALGEKEIDRELWADFSKRLFYVRGDTTDPTTFARLEEAIGKITASASPEVGRNRLYYLATLPSLYPQLIQGLGELEANRPDKGWGRIIVEKPFGRDLASAIELNKLLRRYFDESQVYRIDHYLGKETVQNIMVFRFANGIFEPIWNRRYIDNVQITVSEDVGVGHRGAYYEEAGALRDMVQNHLLQLLGLVAMEPPASFGADAVRNEKVKVLGSIPLPDYAFVARNSVRGQYTAGVINGESVPGYLEEPNVAPNSTTETYVALRLGIENWRWAGVPFFIQTGKRLASRASRISIYFKRAPYLPFQRYAVPDLKPNCLVLNIQPEQGVTLSIGAKVPGPQVRIRNVDMEFSYDRTFRERSPEAYEHLLLEAVAGDTTMFTRDDEVEAAWRIVTAIRTAWDQGAAPIRPYPAGSTGPNAKHGLLGSGRVWNGG